MGRRADFLADRLDRDWLGAALGVEVGGVKQYIVIEKRTGSTFTVQVVAAEIGQGTWRAIPKIYRTHKEALAKMDSRHTTVCGKSRGRLPIWLERVA